MNLNGNLYSLSCSDCVFIEPELYKIMNIISGCVSQTTPQSTEVPYLDHGEAENEPIEKVYVTTLVTPMGLFNYVDGINSKITPKK